MNISKKFKLIIPVYNGGKLWKECVASVLNQGVQIEDVVIVDSGSTDGSYELAQASGFNTHKINKSDFNHGTTRQDALKYTRDAEIIIYMTQDALLDGANSINNIVNVFDDPDVGCAFGRQLPRNGAGPLEKHARYFNYPETSYIRQYADKEIYGIKTAFISNSFAAYRREAMDKAQGFPSNIILGEDTYLAAKMLKEGYKLAYVSNACVKHSHGYTLFQEFKRYFDIGVFYFQNNWLLDEFGKPEGEGMKYVKSELAYIIKNNPVFLPVAIASHFFKFAGYKMGKLEKFIPLSIKKSLSMHKSFWDTKF